MGMKERQTTTMFVLKDRNELEVDYYGRLEEVVELQYHSEQNNVFIIVLKPDPVIDSVK
jgi:hypothetical protein